MNKIKLYLTVAVNYGKPRAIVYRIAENSAELSKNIGKDFIDFVQDHPEDDDKFIRMTTEVSADEFDILQNAPPDDPSLVDTLRKLSYRSFATYNRLSYHEMSFEYFKEHFYEFFQTVKFG